jgi:hypothetical protein
VCVYVFGGGGLARVRVKARERRKILSICNICFCSKAQEFIIFALEHLKCYGDKFISSKI